MLLKENGAGEKSVFELRPGGCSNRLRRCLSLVVAIFCRKTGTHFYLGLLQLTLHRETEEDVLPPLAEEVTAKPAEGGFIRVMTRVNKGQWRNNRAPLIGTHWHRGYLKRGSIGKDCTLIDPC
jgi:hypothetical protein